MQRQHLLPIELVWELVVCIPADHLIRLYRSGPTRSTALNIILAKFYHPYVLLEIKRKSMEFVEKVKIETLLFKEIRERYPPLLGKEQMLLAQAYEHADRLETVIPKMSDENVFKAATLSIIRQIYENLNAATSSVDLPSTHPMIQAACLGMELRKLLNDPALTPESDH